MWAAPIVDMEDPEASAVIAKACYESGFFYLENHGVSEEMMRQVFQQSKAFFSLDLGDKMAVRTDKNNRGYMPMYDQALDPKNQAKGDTKEGYYIFRELAAESEDATRPLRGPNQWPSETLVPGWKATMQEHFLRMQALGERLVGLLAVGLGVDPEFFEGCFKECWSAMRLLHYSSEVSDPEKGVLGTGAHSDFGLITILATDDVPGLQVKIDDEWLDVLPRPGAFICNLGDMLQRWTNDNLKSTVHRVVNKAGRERYSIPFFFEPDFDTEVVCMPQFCSEEDPPKYPAVTSGKYLIDKYLQTQKDFKGVQNEE